MSKVAEYLQSHLFGEVSTRESSRDEVSRDASVLKITPEMVVYPSTTNDIRKTARFAWQLAEKGHTLTITTRGAGTDETGAAIGKGISLVTTAHMHHVYEVEPKQRLVRVQPGVMFGAVNSVLGSYGLSIMSAPASSHYSSIGGAVANNASGPFSGKYGRTGNYVKQLEVVLANGDVLQTGRLSRRELNKKKGEQGFEGDIYRGIDALIDDNKDLIKERFGTNRMTNVGYAGIADVKLRDGSFDLTPLFVGSQGTLGIISEMIMSADFVNMSKTYVAMAFRSANDARDALDLLRTLDPAALDYYDATLFKEAKKRGRTYSLFKEVDVNASEVVVVAIFDDFNERHRKKKLKKINKTIVKTAMALSIADESELTDLPTMRHVTNLFLVPEGREGSCPPIVDGIYIPHDRFENFCQEVGAIAQKFHTTLPVFGRAMDGVYHVRTTLNLKKATDKQIIFRLLDEISKLVSAMDGELISEGGEGRLKTRFARADVDAATLELFKQVKQICDPYNILNPGVKLDTDLKKLADSLVSDYDLSELTRFAPYL